VDSIEPSQTTAADAGPSNPRLRRFLEAQREMGPLVAWTAVVGVGAGAIGGVYRLAIARLQVLHDDVVRLVPPDSGWLVGGALSATLVVLSVWLVRRFAPEAGGSGIQEVEGALDGVRPMRWHRLLPVKFFGGLASLGAGLVLGREGPTVQMGAGVGRMVGDLLRRDADAVHVLVAAGAGAGLTAAFNAPMAGVLFVIEEMRPQFRYSVLSVQCLIVASALADLVVRIIAGGAVAVPMPIVDQPPMHHLWMFLVLGAILGVLGAAFNAALVGGVDVVSRLGSRGALAAAFTIGAGIGVLAWHDADLVWDGENVIEQALAGVLPLGTMLALVVGRFGTTVASYASGAPGGIFAPMLALGTLTGVSFGTGLAPWLGSATPPAVFAVAGMGALFAASVRAPLTGMLLAVELTDNYAQFLPLMLTCVAATLVAHGLGARPIYTVLLERLLARDGAPLTAAGTSPSPTGETRSRGSAIEAP
jgi:CIC family chloride channel protein